MQQNQIYLLDLLETSYVSPDNKKRSEAQALLEQSINSNPSEFVQTTCQYLSQQDSSQGKKTLILTALRALLKPGPQSVWFKITSEDHQKLKATAFNQLIDKNESIMNMAAYLLSNIFVLSLSDQEESSEILASIVANVSNQMVNIKKAAIMTLSTICELLSQEKITTLNDDQIDKILFGICSGLKEFSELTQTSLKGLYYSIEFLKPKLQQETICDYIYETLLNTLQDGIKASSEDIISQTILCLMEISIHLYDKIQKYNQILQERVFVCKDVQSSKVVNIFQQFFIELLQKEQQMNMHYFDISYEHLVTYCVEFFKKINKEEDYQDQQNSLIKSTQQLLKLLNTIYIEKTFDVLFGFVQQNFYQDSQGRSQGLLILHSLLIDQTKQHSQLKLFISQTFSVLVNMMGQTNEDQLQRAITFSFMSEAALYQTDVFMRDQNFLKIIQKILMFFNEQNSEQDLLDKQNCLGILTNLIESVQPHDKDSLEKLNSYAENIIDKIINDLKNQTSLAQLDSGYNLIYVLLSKVVDTKYFAQFYKKFYNHLEENKNNVQNKELFLYKCNVDYIILGYILGRVFSENYNFLATISTELLHQGFVFTDQLFQFANEIQNEGLYYMSLIVNFEKEFAEQDLPRLIQYVNASLQDYKNEVLFTTGLECLNIVITGFQDNVQELVDSKLPQFLQLTRDPDVNDRITLRLFNCLQDFAFKYPKKVIQHLDDYMLIVTQSLEAQIYFLNENKKQRDQVWQFIQSIVEVLEFMIQGIYVEKEFSHLNSKIEQFIIKCTSLFEQICQNYSSELSLEFVSELGIMFADFYKVKQDTSLINMQFLQNLYQFMNIQITKETNVEQHVKNNINFFQRVFSFSQINQFLTYTFLDQNSIWSQSLYWNKLIHFWTTFFLPVFVEEEKFIFSQTSWQHQQLYLLKVIFFIF